MSDVCIHIPQCIVFNGHTIIHQNKLQKFESACTFQLEDTELRRACTIRFSKLSSRCSSYRSSSLFLVVFQLENTESKRPGQFVLVLQRGFEVWVHFAAVHAEKTSKNMPIQYMFQRLEGRSVTSSAQGVTPLTSTGLSNPSADSSFSDTHHLVPRPAPYDTDPRYSRVQRDGLVSRREKSMSHIQEDSQLLTRSSSSSCVEHLDSGKKKNSADSEEECKACCTESEKLLSAKGSYGTGYVFATSEDEDVCPTCLDEYTPENPKIITKCSHHFHLGCIYEWMERSEFCPLCGKEMEFCESP